MTIIHTDAVGADVGHSLGITDEAWVYVSEGTILGSTSFYAIQGTGADQRVTISGEAVGYSYYSIYLSGEGAVVTVNETGIVSAPNGTLHTSGILLTEADGYLSNHGMISGRTGVDLEQGEIINTGVISGIRSNNSTGDGILISGTGTTRITNIGTISAHDDAIRTSTSPDPDPNLVLHNEGDILGDLSLSGSGYKDIWNSGYISGSVVTSGGLDEFHNSGLVANYVSLGGDRYSQQ